MQEILIHMLNNKFVCDFTTQSIYRNRSYFSDEMNRLVRYTIWVKKQSSVKPSGHLTMQFRLTMDGQWVAQHLKRMKELSEHERDNKDNSQARKDG
jgi:hypothetical protein